MPSLALADAFRYFFAPFILFFYLVVYDASRAQDLQVKFGSIGVISFLVAGSVIYFLYRILIYDIWILWLYDVFRKETYRRYLGSKYKICSGKKWSPICTMRAKILYIQINLPDDSRNRESLRLAAARVHLLYQAGFLAIPFMILSVHKGMCSLPFIFFAVLALLLCFTGALADRNYEEQELILLKSVPAAIDEAARKLGYAKIGEEG